MGGKCGKGGFQRNDLSFRLQLNISRRKKKKECFGGKGDGLLCELLIESYLVKSLEKFRCVEWRR